MATKHRYCAFEVYEDSAPADWWQVLKDSHGMYARSFHHGDAEDSKEHYHVMYCHGNSARDDALVAMVPEGIAANGHIEVVAQPRGYMRYLIHLDDPEKEQFPEGKAHIETCNGFPLDLSREISQEEKRVMLRDLLTRIRVAHIYDYSELMDALADNGMDDYYPVVTSYHHVIKAYIDSRRYKRNAEIAAQVASEVMGERADECENAPACA